MSKTSAPRKKASLAIATPIVPLLGLLMNLTGSKYSLVGPAVTAILKPSRSLPLANIVATNSEMNSISGKWAKSLTMRGSITCTPMFLK
uniref:Uncharacterized protein n=1 Tax=Candidatus Aramenus sulfurataquae TaxID=1326980 RepID=A0A0F2LRI9_9CREN